MATRPFASAGTAVGRLGLFCHPPPPGSHSALCQCRGHRFRPDLGKIGAETKGTRRAVGTPTASPTEIRKACPTRNRPTSAARVHAMKLEHPGRRSGHQPWTIASPGECGPCSTGMGRLVQQPAPGGTQSETSRQREPRTISAPCRAGKTALRADTNLRLAIRLRFT